MSGVGGSGAVAAEYVCLVVGGGSDFGLASAAFLFSENLEVGLS